MKRIIFSFFALVAVVASCTKSEMIQSPGLDQEITFNTYVGKVPTTKANSVDLAYLQAQTKAFHVNAFLHKATNGSDIVKTTPYMDKDVKWVSNTSATVRPEVYGETKVIFTSSTSEPTVPTVAESNTYDEFTVPTGWTDEPSSTSTASTHYVVCKYDETTKVWTVGEVVELVSINLGYWDYDGVCYWPDPTSNNLLAFTAYGLNAKTTPDATDKTKLSFVVDPVVANQQDLVVAPFQPGQSLNATASNTSVTLNFKHLLSRVGFKLVANQENKVEVIIKNVALKGKFSTSGTVDLTLTEPKISPAEVGADPIEYKLLPDNAGFVFSASTEEAPIHKNCTINLDTNQDATATKETEANIAENLANRYMMVIPNETASSTRNYTITVEYQLQDSEPQTAVVELNSWAFMPGYSYEFVLKVSTSAVGFYVEISDWNDYYPTGGTGTGSDVTGIYPLTPKVD